MSRYINEIFILETGTFYSNADLLPPFQGAIEKLTMAAADKDALHKAVNYFLMGQRSRRAVDGWFSLNGFQAKAQAFEKGVDDALDSLAANVSQAFADTGIIFDAVLTTSSTGSTMPSVSYRIARRLPHLIPADSLMIDLGNVGCTASMKALNLANSLSENFKNILVVSIEVPSTLANLQSTSVDVWQGNCTFGDGSVALWVSSDAGQGAMGLELEQIRYTQKAQQGLELIYWGYEGYYTFKLGDPNTFERDVQSYILEALEDTQSIWQDNPLWAIHPAGIAILLKLSRKLKLPRQAIMPSAANYEQYSNMSSASIMYILKDLVKDCAVGQGINLLSMGAGFNVVYGYLKKVR